MSASLAWGLASGGLIGLARLTVILGILWLWAERRRSTGYASFALLFGVLTAAYGVWQELPLSLMFLGALGALLGWDLSAFRARLRRASPGDDVHSLERHHLARVWLVAGLGIAWASLLAWRPLRWFWELAIAFVALALFLTLRLIVPRLIRFFQQEE